MTFWVTARASSLLFVSHRQHPSGRVPALNRRRRDALDLAHRPEPIHRLFDCCLQIEEPRVVKSLDLPRFVDHLDQQILQARAGSGGSF